VGENPDTGGKIRVLLADDHTMFRQGLAGILASYGGMEVVAEVPNDAGVLELAHELSPDVVVMQVQLPVERAKRTLEAMRAFPHAPKVVICTMFESPRYAEHLVGAVRAAVLDPEGPDAVVGMPRSMLEGTRDGADSVLSARELKILLLAASPTSG